MEPIFESTSPSSITCHLDPLDRANLVLSEITDPVAHLTGIIRSELRRLASAPCRACATITTKSYPGDSQPLCEACHSSRFRRFMGYLTTGGGTILSART